MDFNSDLEPYFIFFLFFVERTFLDPSFFGIDIDEIKNLFLLGHQERFCNRNRNFLSF